MESLFCCPVCGGRLNRVMRVCRCERGHSYDLAREGYVNLLPANFRHSASPGDDRDMVAARTRFLDGGWYEPLRQRLCKLSEDAAPDSAPALLDAGCGDGYYTAALCESVLRRGGRVAGVDLSKAAVRRAAKRCPKAEIAVSSVYRLPLADGSADQLLDCFSPLAAEEFHRVLKQDGIFFYVVPGPRHLWELKEVLYERPYENEEKREEYPGLRLTGVEAVETTAALRDIEDILALYHMTPYTWKTPKEGAERLRSLTELTVTVQFRIHMFQKI
ncbi:MAG: methyltransferase domain-containing protein [Oscillospiraceae bacterium]|nr:methyltransferase domain-containing protein [Oscillospiraceae bacterium]